MVVAVKVDAVDIQTLMVEEADVAPLTQYIALAVMVGLTVVVPLLHQNVEAMGKMDIMVVLDIMEVLDLLVRIKMVFGLLEVLLILVPMVLAVVVVPEVAVAVEIMDSFA